VIIERRFGAEVRRVPRYRIGDYAWALSSGVRRSEVCSCVLLEAVLSIDSGMIWLRCVWVSSTA
jgi:hypothetical protein